MAASLATAGSAGIAHANEVFAGNGDYLGGRGDRVFGLVIKPSDLGVAEKPPTIAV